MIKILVYGLSNGWGGIEAIVTSIISGMDASKYAFDFIMSSNSECTYQERMFNKYSRIYKIKPWGANPFVFYKELRQILQQSPKYDFVWIHTSSASNIAVQKAAKKYSSAQVILHAHSTSFEASNFFKYHILLLLHRLNHKKFLELIDIPFACSHESAKWLYGDNYIKSHPVKYINNGIVVSKFKFNPITRELLRIKMSLEHKFVLIHIGRFCYVKNQKFVIDVFSELCKKKSNAMLLLVGDGETKNDLFDYANRLNISEKIHFLGERSDVESLLQVSDLLLLPSFYEGFPLTIVEAQAAGLPSLVSNTLTNEIKLTNTVSYLSLKEGAKYWADYILSNNLNYKRIDTSIGVIEAGFDIEKVTKDVESVFTMNM